MAWKKKFHSNFDLKDAGRSGDREIWHKIKKTVPKWSAHTLSCLALFCPSVGPLGQQQEFPNFTTPGKK